MLYHEGGCREMGFYLNAGQHSLCSSCGPVHLSDWSYAQPIPLAGILLLQLRPFSKEACGAESTILSDLNPPSSQDFIIMPGDVVHCG
jgi:hypothetical protein